MAIPYPCGQCGTRLKSPSGTSGCRAMCPGCGAINTVPGRPAPVVAASGAGRGAAGAAAVAVPAPSRFEARPMPPTSPRPRPAATRPDDILPGSRLCPACLRLVDAAEPFCTECGAFLLNEARPAATPAAGAAGGPSPAPVDEAARLSELFQEDDSEPEEGPRRTGCRNCGYAMVEGAVRCPRCKHVRPGRASDLIGTGAAANDSQLTTVDRVACFIIPDVCVILGIIRAARGDRTGGPMIGLALLCFVIRFILFLLFCVAPANGGTL